MKIIDDLGKKLAESYFKIESNETLGADEKVRRIIHLTCAGCAGVAATPIPVADFFLLTPIQGYMGYKIALVRGFPISREQAGRIVKEVLGVVGLGFLARQIAVSALKFIPVWGSLANIPVVYGLTFAIGQVMDYYFTEKAAGRTAYERVMKKLFKDARVTGEKEGEAFAKTNGETGEKENEITHAFLEAKDRFVKDARQAFEEMYINFTRMVSENFRDEEKIPVEEPSHKKPESQGRQTRSESKAHKVKPRPPKIPAKPKKSPISGRSVKKTPGKSTTKPARKK